MKLNVLKVLRCDMSHSWERWRQTSADGWGENFTDSSDLQESAFTADYYISFCVAALIPDNRDNISVWVPASGLGPDMSALMLLLCGGCSSMCISVSSSLKPNKGIHNTVGWVCGCHTSYPPFLRVEEEKLLILQSCSAVEIEREACHCA